MADIRLDSGVYAIACDETGTLYIGETSCTFERRWSEHLRALERGLHHCKLLQEDWAKRGCSAFSFQVLQVRNGVVSNYELEEHWLKEARLVGECYNFDPKCWRGVPRAGKGEKRQWLRS